MLKSERTARIDLEDPRFTEAQRIFLSGDEERLDEARALLAELLLDAVERHEIHGARKPVEARVMQPRGAERSSRRLAGCIIDGCGENVCARRLCRPHYVQALTLIKRGEDRWSDLWMRRAFPATGGAA